jgi:enoyl-[acyl-carrier protein] reductase III
VATIEEIDALVAPATPHFAYQIRARVEELVKDLPEDNPVRRREDGAARPPRPRVLEGRRGAARVAEPAGLGGDPELGPRGPAAPVGAMTILVTGGSRGIGREVARRFARDGAKRIAIGYLRNDAAAVEAAEELRGLGAEPVLVRGNVASSRVAEEVAALGPLDALVHCAATGVIRPALETTDKHFDWTLAANARAFLSLARAAAPQMPRGSTLVAVSSLGSVRVLENYVLVGTSKAALEALVRYLAVELAPLGIRVNAVSGGVVETGALDHFPNREAMLAGSLARTPAGRLVEPADVADAVAFLCSPGAEMIRGQTLIVDGGFSLVV